MNDGKPDLDDAIGSCVRNYNEHEKIMINIFDRLSNTSDAIPLDTLAKAEELRRRLPQSFDEMLDLLVDHVGHQSGCFEPVDADEFLQKVIEFVTQRENNPSIFTAVARPDAVS